MTNDTVGENTLKTKNVTINYHGDFEDDGNFEYATDFKTMVIISTMTITEHEQAGDEKTAGGWSEHTWSCFIAR